MCTFSLMLLDGIHYSYLKLPSYTHICTPQDSKAFWLQKVLNIANHILQTRLESSKETWYSNDIQKDRAAGTLKILRGNMDEMFGLLLAL